jgi:hypothetical protein
MPTDVANLAILGDAYMADRKPELALQQFEKATALDPDNPPSRNVSAYHRSMPVKASKVSPRSNSCSGPRPRRHLSGPRW